MIVPTALLIGLCSVQFASAFTTLGVGQYAHNPAHNPAHVVPAAARRANTNIKSLQLSERRQRLATFARDAVGDDANNSPSNMPSINRRDLLRSSAAGAAILLSQTCNNNVANAAAPLPALPYGTPSSPILIIGGNGRTGMAVAEQLATAGLTTAVSTRTGKDPFAKIRLPPDVREKMQFYDSSATGGVDVRNMDSIVRALRDTGAGAVVYAASASRAGGNASEVDGTGPANVAQAIMTVGGDIRLVLISALALDRPDSKSYQITNTMGGYIDKIMDEKYRGEEAVRTIMKGKGKSAPGNYVIVRPGPLLSGKSKNGAADLELNQGDTVGGGLSRDELAGVVVGALVAGEVARGTTVECYRSRTATALQPEFALPTGRELRGDTYAALFRGAKKD